MTHVTPEFALKLRETLSSFQLFAAARTLSRGRFLLYAGVDRPNAWDLEPTQFTDAIAEWLAEGYMVGWESNGECLYLYAQEPDCPIPPADKLFKEEALADVDAILKAAGFTDAS